jgi:hypothetical protein
MAGGYVSQAFPEEYSCWPIFHDLVAADYRSGRRGQLLAFLRAKGVGAVLAPEGYVSTAEPLLRDLPGEQRSLGRMRVYLLPESFSETPGDACPS